MNNQRKIISVLLLVLFFVILSNSYAAPLDPDDFNQNAIAAEDVIELFGDEIYTPGELSISKSIIIKSSDSSKNAIIDLKKNGRGFKISNTGNLTLIGITIINGRITASYDGGAAILNDRGNLTVINCSFINNQGPWGGHGAIWNQGGIVNVSNCTFINNSGDDYGGAIANYRTFSGVGSVVVTNSKFINNSASNGGAIVNFDGCTLIVVNCSFNKNTATINSGAIGNFDGVVTVIFSIFTNNRAEGGGQNDASAISSLGGSLNVNFSVFYNNTGGNRVIIHRDGGSCSLKDNFYFNPSLRDLNDLLASFTNNLPVDGLYYFNISHNTVNSVSDLLKIDSLSYSGVKPVVNPLPDLDINLYHNDDLVQSYDYKSETGGIALVNLNNFVFSFMGDDFATFTLDFRANTKVAIELLSAVDDLVQLKATVTDHSGVLVGGVDVDFFVNGVFVGSNTTGLDGVAIFHYRVNSVRSEIYANFTANGDFHGNISEIIVFTFNPSVPGKPGHNVPNLPTVSDQPNSSDSKIPSQSKSTDPKLQEKANLPKNNTSNPLNNKGIENNKKDNDKKNNDKKDNNKKNNEIEEIANTPKGMTNKPNSLVLAIANPISSEVNESNESENQNNNSIDTNTEELEELANPNMNLAIILIAIIILGAISLGFYKIKKP